MGRPPGRIQLHPFQMRVSAAFLKLIDVWRLKQPDQPSRAEAIRRLVDMALASSKPRRGSPDAAQKALKLATEAVEKLTEKSAPAEEQQRRKRRLIRGPSEFREIRKDQPKR